MLTEQDKEYLESKGWRWEEHPHGAEHVLVICGYELPAGYSPAKTGLLIEIPADYPDAKLDMFWCNPFVTFAHNGASPPATESTGNYLDQPWQRFSRHLDGWRPGVDTIKTYLRWIRSHLEHDVRAAGG